jgi:transcription elongation factor SPT6
MPQVMARYVEPLVSHLKSFLKHRKFLKGTKEEVDAAAKKEKARRPGTFPYFLSVNLEHMGMLTLTYVTNQNPHHEYIVVTPKGFTYRRRNFSNPDKLIAYFKKHYQEVRIRRSFAAAHPPSPHVGGLA